MKKTVPLVIGTLLFAAFILKSGVEEIGHLFNSERVNFIIPVILLNLPVLFLKTWRWKILLGKYNISLPFSGLFSSVSAGFFLGLVTPGTVGEVGRIYAVDIKKSTGAGTLVFEKFFDLVSLFLLSVSALLIFLLKPAESLIAVFAVSFVTASCVVFIFRKKLLLQLITKYKSRAAVLERINSLVQIVDDLMRDLKLVTITALTSLGIWTISGLQFYLILKMFGISASAEMVLVSYFIPYLAGVISFIPFGLGVMDFSLAGIMTGIYGIAGPAASGAALNFRLFATFPLVLFGYGCYIYKFMHKKTGIFRKIVFTGKDQAP